VVSFTSQLFCRCWNNLRVSAYRTRGWLCAWASLDALARTRIPFVISVASLLHDTAESCWTSTCLDITSEPWWCTRKQSLKSWSTSTTWLGCQPERILLNAVVLKASEHSTRNTQVRFTAALRKHFIIYVFDQLMGHFEIGILKVRLESLRLDPRLIYVYIFCSLNVPRCPCLLTHTRL
jgi:hypothetical protein